MRLKRHPQGMKKRILCFLILLTFCMAAGCISYDPENNKMDARGFYANIKADAFSQHGKKAACYDGRIYYLGAELGTQGVYSMSSDGTDIRFEFPAEDIRALYVNGDVCLYAGFDGIAENSHGAYRRFRLLRRQNAETIDVLAQPTLQAPLERLYESYFETAPEDDAGSLAAFQAQQAAYRAQIDELSDCNVWDFYTLPNGDTVVRTLGLNWVMGTNHLCAVTITDGKLALAPAFSAQADVSVPSGCKQETVSVSWFALHTLIMSSDNIGGRFDGDIDFVQYDAYSLYDTSAGTAAFGIERSIDAPFAGPWLYRVVGTKATFAASNALSSCDWATGDVTELCRFPRAETIYAVHAGKSATRILTQTRGGTGFISARIFNLFDWRHVLSESLYRLDPETGERERLLKLGYGQSFVFVDEAYAAFAKGNTVHVYDITGKTATKISDCTLLHPIVTDENKVEVAGDWLFLYGFNENTGRDELLEKIRFRNTP